MNRDHIIKELHKDNLCTYFVLPLLKLSKFRFIADSNFIDSFLSEDKKLIFVQVLETLFLEYRLQEHPDYKGVYKDNLGNKFIVYAIPEQFHYDVEKFVSGRYSSMSEEAKELIQEYSGLYYRYKQSDDKIVTDIRLLALEKADIVRDLWEDALACTLEDGQELLSIPGKESFMTISSLTEITAEVYS